MQRKMFGRVFKLAAVNLFKQRRASVAQAARDLDIDHNSLRRWVKELAGDPENAFPGLGHLKLAQLEIDRLRKEAANWKCGRVCPPR